MKSIGIIGHGNIGSAIYDSVKDSHKVFLYDPLKKQGSSDPYETDFDEFAKKSEVIIVCVKPDKVAETLKKIREPKIILSVAAGISIATLRENSPALSKVVRLMPNLPMTVSQGVIGYIGDTEAYQIVKSVFTPMGYLQELGSEDALNAITGLSGSGPAFVFSFIQALAEGGVKSGLGYADALRISIQTVKGSVSLMEKELEKNPDLHPYTLRNKATSPGGTTIFGLDALEKGKFTFSVIDAVFSAFERAKELGKK
ncbi:MAG: pyrroline-5-carboxylate reductase [Leptospira sp.]|nr:pyrroline-5-carboxylate reductase [Leptospira sp.]